MRRVTEDITPERARELLKSYDIGNVLNKTKMLRFKELMQQGKWMGETREFIYIRNGKVMNGHHRLTAIAESGVTVRVRIQYD